jgi:four helix bundle protein
MPQPAAGVKAAAPFGLSASARPAGTHGGLDTIVRLGLGGVRWRGHDGPTEETTMTTHTFPHDKLDAFRVAREARKLAFEFTKSLPSGHSAEAKQINSAAASVVRNICEGANRFRAAEKVLKFEIAAGEAGEAAGAVVSLVDCGLGDEALAARFLQLESRVGAMLTGLIRRQRR